ncbi:hypothetical protein TeGR_g976 [Tetraparma gracilis]|uniref:Uncharacterized protein n=1 Tax=Tetraparma gracilis TaxID=2962635 RepID=A0ABQ6MGP7_9STRA|nr:hypothetical protein TeGR_g976 [Tetraparma gracilis]
MMKLILESKDAGEVKWSYLWLPRLVAALFWLAARGAVACAGAGPWDVVLLHARCVGGALAVSVALYWKVRLWDMRRAAAAAAKGKVA